MNYIDSKIGMSQEAKAKLEVNVCVFVCQGMCQQ